MQSQLKVSLRIALIAFLTIGAQYISGESLEEPETPPKLTIGYDIFGALSDTAKVLRTRIKTPEMNQRSDIDFTEVLHQYRIIAALLDALASDIDSFHGRGASEFDRFLLYRMAWQLPKHLDEISKAIENFDPSWTSGNNWPATRRKIGNSDTFLFYSIISSLDPSDPEIARFSGHLRDAARLAKHLSHSCGDSSKVDRCLDAA